jgi:hypothetical protein
VNVGDLLDARVVGPDDEPLGVVVDVRLALEILDEPDDAGVGDREENLPLRETTAARDAVRAARLIGLIVAAVVVDGGQGAARARVTLAPGYTARGPQL